MKGTVAYIFPHNSLTEKMHFRDGYIPGVGDVKYLSDKNYGEYARLNTSGMHFRGVMIGAGVVIGIDALVCLMGRVRTDGPYYFQLQQEQKQMLVNHVQKRYQEMISGEETKWRERDIRKMLDFYSTAVGIDLGIEHKPIPYIAKVGSISLEEVPGTQQVFLRQESDMAHHEDIVAINYGDIGLLVHELRHVQQMVSGMNEE